MNDHQWCRFTRIDYISPRTQSLFFMLEMDDNLIIAAGPHGGYFFVLTQPATSARECMHAWTKQTASVRSRCDYQVLNMSRHDSPNCGPKLANREPELSVQLRTVDGLTNWEQLMAWPTENHGVLIPLIWPTRNHCQFVLRFLLSNLKPPPAIGGPLDRVSGDRVRRERHFSGSSCLTISTKSSKMAMQQGRGDHFRSDINPIKHTPPPQTPWLLPRCCGAVAPRSKDCHRIIITQANSFRRAVASVPCGIKKSKTASDVVVYLNDNDGRITTMFASCGTLCREQWSTAAFF